MTIAFVLIAIVINIFIQGDIKQFVKSLLLICLTAAITIGLLSSVLLREYKFIPELKDQYQFPYEHWMMMTLNGAGGYNQDDVNYTMSFDSYEERRQADIDNTHLTVTFNEDDVIYENLTEKRVDEVKENTEALNKEENTENEAKAPEEERTFKLAYPNFMKVNETNGLFLFYLDRQTVIILPKETYISDYSLKEFKEFILTKIDKKRIKLLKEKN